MTRNLGPLLIILIVLVVAVSASYARTGSWPTFLSNLGLGGNSLTLVEKAGEGLLIEGFPEELLGVVSDAEITDSGRYSDEGGGSVLVATYVTSAPISEMFAAYINHLTDHGYEVLSADAKRGVTSITAGDRADMVTISMSPKSFGVNEVRIDVRERVLE